MDDYNKKYSAADQQAIKLPGVTFEAPADYSAHNEHLANFFDSIRTGKPVVENAEFGFRAAAPALACNDSYFQNKVINWDANQMKLK